MQLLDWQSAQAIQALPAGSNAAASAKLTTSVLSTVCWEKLTPRMCLTHSTGFSNFWFIEPDQKLHLHFELGTRYSYSGEGFILMQFVIEHGREMQGVCIEASQRCVLILSNDVRFEAGFADLVRFILGDTGVPYDWEYGDHAGKS